MPATPPPDHDEGSRSALRAERQRLARLLHDSLSQSLTAAYLHASVLAQKMEREHSGFAAETGRLAERFHEVVVGLREVVQTLGETDAPAGGTGQAS